MSTVSYEILTKVQKRWRGVRFMGYNFKCQIIVTEMNGRDYRQLEMPVHASGMAIIPMNIHVRCIQQLDDEPMKGRIDTRMELVKKSYEKMLRPVRQHKRPVILASGGNFKDELSR
jgi:hypothetical protein